MPAEGFLLPKVAPALNARLSQARVPGVDESATATLSIEAAQLQAECSEVGEACWSRVAQMYGTDQLLWAEMEKLSKKKRGPVRVRVVLFDAHRAAVVGRSEATFTNTASDADLDKLVGEAIGVLSPPPAGSGAPASPQ